MRTIVPAVRHQWNTGVGVISSNRGEGRDPVRERSGG